jgi:hypothetical protein
MPVTPFQAATLVSPRYPARRVRVGATLRRAAAAVATSIVLGLGAAGADAAPVDGPSAKEPEGARTAGVPPRPIQGVLDVATTPAARVFLDGRPLGVTPIRNLTVDAGQHELVVTTLDGKVTRRQMIVINAGETARFRLQLSPPP